MNADTGSKRDFRGAPSNGGRRCVLRAGIAAGALAVVPGYVRAQSPTTLDVLMTNRLVFGELREVVEREANIKVNDAPFQSVADTLSRILAPGGTSRYSMIVTQTGVARKPLLGENAGAEKVSPLDLSKIPNAASVAEIFKEYAISRDGKMYAIPVTAGYDSVVYNASVVPEKDEYTQSWGMLFEDKYAGRIAWFDSALHMILIAGLYLGKPRPELISAAELSDITKFLISKKKNVRTLYTSFAQGANQIASGEVVCTYGPIPLRSALQQQGVNVKNSWCKEGVLSFVSGAAIPKDSPNQDRVHAFINSMLGAAYASRLTRISGYLSTSTNAAKNLSAAEARQAGYGILDGSVKHYPNSLPPNLNTWIEAWSRVKSA
ncbi:MAG: extracellular solute-binding protein [Proteobacteria bacterium]|nr:extracellular solute-binding protein [Pseudomonadota bacterium]